MQLDVRPQFSSYFRKTFHSLRNRNFKLFFWGQLISNTGNWLTNVAITLLVLKITNSGIAVGWLAACQYGPILIFSAWAGAIVDRLDKRKSLLITQTLEMTQSAGLAIVAFMPHPSLPALYILAAFGGLFLAFDNPLRRSFVGEMVPEEDLPNAVVLYSTIINISRIFGPTLAGLLIITLGYGWCFTFDAISYLAVLASLLMMITAQLHRLPPKLKAKGEVMAGVRYIKSVPNLWISFVMMALIGTLAYNFTVTLPLFVTKTLHSSETVFTFLYSILSFGSVLTALVVAHRNLTKMRHLLFGSVAFGLAMLILGFAPGLKTAIIAVFLIGASSILYTTATTTLVQVESQPQFRGRVLALQTVLFIGSTPIGGPISGWLADFAGARIPILLGGVVCLIAAGFGYIALKSSKTDQQEPQSA